MVDRPCAARTVGHERGETAPGQHISNEVPSLTMPIHSGHLAQLPCSQVKHPYELLDSFPRYFPSSFRGLQSAFGSRVFPQDSIDLSTAVEPQSRLGFLLRREGASGNRIQTFLHAASHFLRRGDLISCRPFFVRRSFTLFLVRHTPRRVTWSKTQHT